MKKIFILGSLAYDNIIISEQPFSELIHSKSIHKLNFSFSTTQLNREFGGCGGNISYNLALLDVSPTLITTIGSDGDTYMDKLENLNIDTSLIERSKDLTAQAYILNDKHNNQITSFYLGAMNSKLNYKKITNKINKDDIVIISPESVENMIFFAKELTNRGISYIFDPGQSISAFNDEEIKVILLNAKILILNDFELDQILEKTSLLLSQLKEEVETIIVTKGEEGSLIIQNGKEYNIAACKVNNVVDPTGCGDALRSGLLYGLSLGYNIKTSVKIGSEIASLNLGHYGTQNHHFTPETLTSLPKDLS